MPAAVCGSSARWTSATPSETRREIPCRHGDHEGTITATAMSCVTSGSDTFATSAASPAAATIATSSSATRPGMKRILTAMHRASHARRGRGFNDSREHFVGLAPFEQRIRPECDSMAQARQRHFLHVVGRHVVAPVHQRQRSRATHERNGAARTCNRAQGPPSLAWHARCALRNPPPAHPHADGRQSVAD